MKKLIPVVIVLSLVLTACGNLPIFGRDEPITDAEMATRMAELLATMTTPTTEIAFPATSTPMPATPVPTATVPQSTAVPATAVPTATVGPTQAPAAGTGTPETTVEPTAAATADATPLATTVATAAPTLTLPDTDPVRKLGEPKSSDPFDSYEKWGWPTDSDDYLKLDFKDGFLQMTGLTTKAGWRLPMISQQTNSYIELTVNSAACADKDSYGIIFRVPVFKEPTQGYLYEVTCDGYLRLWKWDGNLKPKGEAEILINWKESPDINTGANKVNRLGVMVVGNNLSIYMNGVPQGSTTDSSFKAGFFGVFVRSVTTPKYMVKFDEMKLWESPAQ